MYSERMPARGTLTLYQDGESVKYTISSVKGCGGTSVIYEAERSNGMRCIIKELAPAFLAEYTFRRENQQLKYPDSVLNSPEYMSAAEDFARSCVMMNRLAFSEATAEESIGAYMMYGEFGVPYIVMEWNPLRAVACDTAEQMSLAEIIQMCLCLARTLKEYHEMGVIHLDVKLSNILWSEKYHYVKLIDLGSAESIDGDNAENVRDDVYAVGSVLFEKLCRRTPEASMGDRTLFLYEKELRRSSILSGCGPKTQHLLFEILRRTICAAGSRRYSDQLLVDRLTNLSRLVSEETIYLISSSESDPDPEAARMLMPYIPRLKKLVRPGSMTAVTSSGPGMGKTELLTLYCRVFRDEYSAVVWLDCRRDVTDQLEFVNNSGRAAYDEEEIRLEKLRLLTECDRDMLFILDNYTPEVPGNILNRFVRRATCIAALSRREDSTAFDSVLNIEPLDQAESRKLLRCLGVTDPRLGAEISAECGGVSALLRIAAEYCTADEHSLSYAAAKYIAEKGALFGIDGLPEPQLACGMSLVMLDGAVPEQVFLDMSGCGRASLDELVRLGFAAAEGGAVCAAPALRAACSGDYRPDSALCRKMYLSLAESPDMINVDLLADKASGADSASAALYSAMGRKCADSSPDRARSLLTRAYMIYAMKYGSDSRLAGETKAALDSIK